MITSQPLLQEPSYRWGISFVVVVALYASAILAVVNWESDRPSFEPAPMGAMMVELAPMPVASITPPESVVEGVLQEKIIAPNEPLPKPEPTPETVVELPEIKQAEAVLAPKIIEPVVEKEPELVDRAERVDDQRPEQQQTAPPEFEAPPNKVATTQAVATPSLATSQARDEWNNLLSGHLKKHKRYPRQARHRGQEATIYVQVEVDREGVVIAHYLTESSEFGSLNKEALAVIRRAEPLPRPPAALTGDTVEFVIPVTFAMQR